MYMKTYNFTIADRNGSFIWLETTYILPLPLKHRRMSDKPTINRIRDASKRVTLSRFGKRIMLNVCKEFGHNKSICKKVDDEIYKRT